MSTSKTSEWLQILASLGVLAGLVFLSLEIQQSNRIALAATEITVREAWGSSNETVYTNPEIAALLAKSRIPDAEFSPTEQEMLVYFLPRVWNIWRGIEKAYMNEMVSRETFDTALEDLIWTFHTYPGMRQNFESHLATYPSLSGSELAQTLNRLLEEN